MMVLQAAATWLQKVQAATQIVWLWTFVLAGAVHVLLFLWYLTGPVPPELAALEASVPPQAPALAGLLVAGLVRVTAAVDHEAQDFMRLSIYAQRYCRDAVRRLHVWQQQQGEE